MEKKAIDYLKQFIESGRDLYPKTSNYSDCVSVDFYFEGVNLYFTLIKERNKLNFHIYLKSGEYHKSDSLSYAEHDFVKEWIDRMKEREEINCLKAFNKIVTPGSFDPNTIEL